MEDADNQFCCFAVSAYRSELEAGE